MGRRHLQHPNGENALVNGAWKSCRTYECLKCSTPIAHEGQVQSKDFKSGAGQAYLFKSVVNVVVKRNSKAVPTSMLTGLHWVRDAFCKSCNTKLGWMYEYATRRDQEYKEGMTVIEVSKLQYRIPIPATITCIKVDPCDCIGISEDMESSSVSSDRSYAVMVDPEEVLDAEEVEMIYNIAEGEVLDLHVGDPINEQQL